MEQGHAIRCNCREQSFLLSPLLPLPSLPPPPSTASIPLPPLHLTRLLPFTATYNCVCGSGIKHIEVVLQVNTISARGIDIRQNVCPLSIDLLCGRVALRFLDNETRVSSLFRVGDGVEVPSPDCTYTAPEVAEYLEA